MIAATETVQRCPYVTGVPAGYPTNRDWQIRGQLLCIARTLHGEVRASNACGGHERRLADHAARICDQRPARRRDRR